MVFDAAAPFRGKCLNDAILAGQALQPSLAAVITGFRAHEIAWASDIEAMFSRFRLASEDAKYFCFLWSETRTTDPKICRMNRLPFGASCFPFVAINAVCRIMEDAGASEFIISAVRESMYVDDYLNSAPTVEEAVGKAAVVRDHLFAADLNLQRWISNSPEFIRKMAGEGINSSHSPFTFGFKVANHSEIQFTRVDLISRVASVFDPLGTASPLIVKAKIRLRELGIKGLKWTDAVVGEDQLW